MLLFYCLIVHSLLSKDLLNKCKIFNIKDSECINSTFVPSSEYRSFISNMNMPIVKDDNCNKNKCLPASSNENIPPPQPFTTQQPIPQQSSQTQQQNSQTQQQSSINTMTLTSTTTSTVVITIPKQTISHKDDCQNINPKENCNEGKDESNEQKNNCNEEKESKNTSKTAKDESPRKKKEIDDSKNNEKQGITTVIREIPTTVTVEVPLTLFREHTTTAISKVPVINYSLTTFTEHNTTTETFFKTSTITSEVLKTTTFTTEVVKTTTIDFNHEKEEDMKILPKYDFNIKDFYHPRQKQNELFDKDVDCKTKGNENLSTVYITAPLVSSISENISTIFVTPLKSEKINTVFLTTTVPEKELATTVLVDKDHLPVKKDDVEITSTVFLTTTIPIKEKVSTVFVTKSVVLPLDATSSVSSIVPSPVSSKLKENCDEDIIPLIKELLKSTLTPHKNENLKYKKGRKKIYKTIMSRKKKKKCIPKHSCKGKKCAHEECEDNESSF